MAELKRQTFQFTSGKQIRLHGNSFFVNKSLEIGEGFVPNLFSLFEEQIGGRPSTSVSNLHKLTPEEIQELADYNIRLWLDLKDNIRKYGANSPRVFSRENIRLTENDKPAAGLKKESTKPDHTEK
jgi:hypothetical protein